MGGRGLVLYCDDEETMRSLPLVVNDFGGGVQMVGSHVGLSAKQTANKGLSRHAARRLLSRWSAWATTD